MLALVGIGEYLPPIEPLARELISRLPGSARVACLPTAAGTEGAERIAYWSRLGSVTSPGSELRLKPCQSSTGPAPTTLPSPP